MKPLRKLHLSPPVIIALVFVTILPACANSEPQPRSEISSDVKSEAINAPDVGSQNGNKERNDFEGTAAALLAQDDAASPEQWGAYARRLGLAADRCRLTEQQLADRVLFHKNDLELFGGTVLAMDLLTDVILFYIPLDSAVTYDCVDTLIGWQALQLIERELSATELADFCRYVSRPSALESVIDGLVENRRSPRKLHEDNIRRICASR